MYIPIIKYPGIILELEPKELNFEIESLLMCMDDALIESALSLSWFNNSMSKHSERVSNAYEQNFKSTSGISKESIKRITNGEIDSLENFLVEKKHKERLESDILPVKYVNKELHIHANTFLFSVSKFSSVLFTLNNDYELNEDIESAFKSFNSSIPDVYRIRNSAQHMNDRVRGLGRNNEKLKTGIYLDNLSGNKLGYTVDDGSISHIEISLKTLKILENSLQTVINSFEWSGPLQFSP